MVFEVIVDDYAEVWVNGALPTALGDEGGHVIAGFNASNRVILTDDARPGETSHNLAWGDADGRGVYITASTSVYRIRTKVAGIRPAKKEER